MSGRFLGETWGCLSRREYWVSCAIALVASSVPGSRRQLALPHRGWDSDSDREAQTKTLVSWSESRIYQRNVQQRRLAIAFLGIERWSLEAEFWPLLTSEVYYLVWAFTILAFLKPADNCLLCWLTASVVPPLRRSPPHCTQPLAMAELLLCDRCWLTPVSSSVCQSLL